MADRLALFYESRWYMFSNFSSFAIQWKGKLWMTVEHAYQAEKFEGADIRNLIWAARSAHEAKQIAKEHDSEKRRDWNEKTKLAVMEKLLRAKLDQHQYVRDVLLATGEAQIVEDSPFDDFWGRGRSWNGKNHLGKIWMKLRAELRSKLQKK